MNPIPFSLWLRQRRRELDITQRELAGHIGCSVETVKKLESGERRPSKEIASLLAHYLTVPPDEHSAFVRFARTASYRMRETPSLHVPNNLPTPSTSFIGRQREVEKATSLLKSANVRLLSLTGPPGIGKTRLSLQIASKLLGEFEDGVYFVALDAVRRPSGVIPAIAQALGLREVPGAALTESLKSYLRSKTLLLVLDNFEQVVEAGPLVGELLTEIGGLKCLVTTRALLHVYGEHELPVPPLGMYYGSHKAHRLFQARGDESRPDTGPDVPTDDEAVQLFIDRARAVQPDFATPGEGASTDLEVLAEICYRLDGLPLAIELAASNTRQYSIEAIRGQLEGKLDLLSGGPLNLPERQQTIRAAISWSYDLLDDKERRLFREISVFAAGCTEEAIASVCLHSAPGGGREVGESASCNGDGGRAAHSGLKLVINSLVDKSLLHRDKGGPIPRFTMLQTIREYAQEQLELSRELESVRWCHTLYFTGLAERAEPHLQGKGQQEWLEALDMEQDNFAAALDWVTESSLPDVSVRAEIALRLSAALGIYWHRRGKITFGRKQLQAALSLVAQAEAGTEVNGPAGVSSNPAGARAKAKALCMGGLLSQRHASEIQVMPMYEEAHSIYLQLGDKGGQATALKRMGDAAHDRSDYDLARNLFAQSHTLFHEAGDLLGEAQTLREIGLVDLVQGDAKGGRGVLEKSLALYTLLEDNSGRGSCYGMLGTLEMYSGNLSQASLYYEQGMRVFRELGDKNSIAICLNNMADIARCTHDYEDAILLLDEGLQLWIDLDDKWCMVMSLHNLGAVFVHLGDFDRARDLFAKGLTIAQQIGAKHGIGVCVSGLAGVMGLMARGDTPACRRAARLLGAANALLDEIGAPFQGADADDYRLSLECIRTNLGSELFEMLQEEGKLLGIDRLIAEGALGI